MLGCDLFGFIVFGSLLFVIAYFATLLLVRCVVVCLRVIGTCFFGCWLLLVCLRLLRTNWADYWFLCLFCFDYG